MGQLRLAIFPGLAAAAGAAQQVDHQLLTVADAQHRDAHGEQGGVHHGGIGLEHRGRAAGKNQRVRLEGADIIHGFTPGTDLAVYAALADAAGDQQVILAAEIKNKYLLHACSSRNTMLPGSALSMMAREWML